MSTRRDDEVFTGRHIPEVELAMLIARTLDQHLVILGLVGNELRRILLHQDLAVLVIAVRLRDALRRVRGDRQ